MTPAFFKEDKFKKTEERLIKKEELLDKRQVDVDKEVEGIREKVSEVKTIREEAEGLRENKKKELERISGLSEEEAKEELLKEVEKSHESNCSRNIV